MKSTSIRLEFDGPVAVATLTRPGKLNAMSRAVVAELTDVAERLTVDPNVRVLVLAGEGRMFSAGADVDEFRQAFGTGAVDPAIIEEDARAGARFTDALAAPELVTIAAIHGAAIGGAAALVAACDLRLMAEGARIAVPELIMGFPLAWGAMPRLVDLLGPSVVRDLLLTCRSMASDEALARGFACRVVPEDVLLDSALELAHVIAAHPAFGTTAALRRVAALAAGAQIDDDAVTLAQAATEPLTMAATRAYLDSL
ncbi:enoyl-CoA hydratase/isomerase family protein [Prescottella equi]|uniref:enoyl-CoA hydratase/isomerase family protein n=1 Tax=Rhodococcus hoagii TaxID=43767 RepID=UPI00301DFAE3